MLRKNNRMYTVLYTGRTKLVSCPISVRADSKHSALVFISRMLSLDSISDLKIIDINYLARLNNV